jgi:hypothetical protein
MGMTRLAAKANSLQRSSLPSTRLRRSEGCLPTSPNFGRSLLELNVHAVVSPSPDITAQKRCEDAEKMSGTGGGTARPSHERMSSEECRCRVYRTQCKYANSQVQRRCMAASRPTGKRQAPGVYKQAGSLFISPLSTALRIPAIQLPAAHCRCRRSSLHARRRPCPLRILLPSSP